MKNILNKIWSVIDKFYNAHDILIIILTSLVVGISVPLIIIPSIILFFQ
jgi:hypothetical protein